MPFRSARPDVSSSSSRRGVPQGSAKPSRVRAGASEEASARPRRGQGDSDEDRKGVRFGGGGGGQAEPKAPSSKVKQRIATGYVKPGAFDDDDDDDDDSDGAPPAPPAKHGKQPDRAGGRVNFGNQPAAAPKKAVKQRIATGYVRKALSDDDDDDDDDDEAGKKPRFAAAKVAAKPAPKSQNQKVKSRIATGFARPAPISDSDDDDDDDEPPRFQPKARGGAAPNALPKGAQKPQDAASSRAKSEAVPHRGGGNAKIQVVTQDKSKPSRTAGQDQQPKTSGVRFSGKEEVLAAASPPSNKKKDLNCRLNTGFARNVPSEDEDDCPKPKVGFTSGTEVVEAASVLTGGRGRSCRTRIQTGAVKNHQPSDDEDDEEEDRDQIKLECSLCVLQGSTAQKASGSVCVVCGEERKHKRKIFICKLCGQEVCPSCADLDIPCLM